MEKIKSLRYGWRSGALLGIAALGLAGAAMAEPRVSDIQAVQRENTKLVDITYRLVSSVPCEVTLKISSDAGSTWSVPAAALTGDVGAEVNPGGIKEIVWNAGTDWDNQWSDRMRIEVTADSGMKEETIGSGGGQITFPEVGGYSARLNIPAGAVPDATTMFIRTLAAPDESALTPAWRVSFGETPLCKPVEVRISGFDGVTGPLFFMFGDIISDDDGASAMIPQLVEAVIEGGTAIITIPAFEDCADEEQDPPPPPPPAGLAGRGAKRQISTRWALTFWVVSGYVAEETDNFRLVYHTAIQAELPDMPRYLLTYAEEAYSKLTNMGFQFRSGLNWPIQIDVKYSMASNDGEMSIPLSGKKNMSININANLCVPDKLQTLRAFIGHEFFHVVQAVYDPRSAIRIRHSWSKAYFHWLGEASSVWFESVMLEDPDYVADIFANFIPSYYNCGLETYTSKQEAGWFGYAASGFLRYLVEMENDQSVILKIWEAVKAQGSGSGAYSDLRALMAGSVLVPIRFSAYMSQLLSDTTGYPDWPMGYRPTMGVYASNAQKITLTNSVVESRESIEPFAASHWTFIFEEVSDDEGDNNFMLSVIEKDPNFHYQVFLAKFWKVGDSDNRPRWHPFEYAAYVGGDNTFTFTAEERDLLLVVPVNTTRIAPYTAPNELAVKLARYGRFTDNEDGTLTDNLTGLMWCKNQNDTTMTWSDAVTYCNNLRTGGYSDWRLPTVNKENHPNCGGGTHPAELDRLGRKNADMNEDWDFNILFNAFSNFSSAIGPVWSGTTRIISHLPERTDFKYWVRMDGGYIDFATYDKKYYVMPVRDSNP